MAADIIMHPSCDPTDKSKQPIEKMLSSYSNCHEQSHEKILNILEQTRLDYEYATRTQSLFLIH